MICTISKHKAERKGYADALMLDWRGQVAECTGANIFFVKNGEIAHADAGLLPRRHHPPHRDRSRPEAPDQGDRARHHAGGAHGFEQCFIVGTAAEVTPVGEIGPYKFKVGDLTRTLRADYLNEVQPKKKAA